MIAKQSKQLIIYAHYEDFVRQSPAYDVLDAAIAIVDRDGSLRYQNHAFINLCKLVHPSRSPERTSLNDCPLGMQALTALVTRCVHEEQVVIIEKNIGIERSSPLVFNLVLRPIMEQHSTSVNGVLISVAEESIDQTRKMKFQLATLQNMRKEMSAEIRKLSRERISRDRLIRSLLRETPFGIMLIDPAKQQILQMNKACEEIFEIKSVHATGRLCKDFLVCYQPRGCCPVCDKNESLVLQETIGLGKDGREIPLLRSTAMLDHDKEPVILEAFIDITERKRAIEESRLATRLAREREWEKGLAIAANKAKSSFIARMSHELRTPLNAILGFSEYGKELLDDEALVKSELTDSFGNIHTAGNHLLTLINDILDLSKVEANKMELCVDAVDLNDLCEEVLVMVEPLLEKNNNKFETMTFKTSHILRTDELRLRQILFNLLSNACKFTQDGLITLKVDKFLKDDKDWARIVVQDTGIGMTEEQAHKVFLEFEQADDSTTRKYGGTGLGLTICKKLALLMQGDISVSSSPGNGSTFIVELPNLETV